MRILLTGSTGLVGRAVMPSLQAQGHGVWHLLRKVNGKGRGTEFLWDVQKETLDLACLKGIDGVIHLAGENIASKRWTLKRKAELAHSRIVGTKLLIDAIANNEHRPKVFISASAVGFYGERGEQQLTEADIAGHGFLSELAVEWENEAQRAKEFGMRTVQLRFGMVLSQFGGALPKIVKPVRMGVGGVLGSGRQYMSWIHLADLVSAMELALNNESIEGPLNVVAPNPVTNREFIKTLGKVLHRPTFFRVPRFALELAFGEMASELLLTSTRAIPARLTQLKMPFKFPTIESALNNIISGEEAP